VGLDLTPHAFWARLLADVYNGFLIAVRKRSPREGELGGGRSDET